MPEIPLPPQTDLLCEQHTEAGEAESSALTTKWMTLTRGLIIRSQATPTRPHQAGLRETEREREREREGERDLLHLQLHHVAATANCAIPVAQAFH